MKKLLLVVTLALCSAGCARVVSSHVLTGQLQAPHGGPVQIVMEGQSPTPGYAEIAIVEGRGNHHAGMNGVMQQLQVDARSLGANAIINVRVDQGATIVSVTGVAVRY